MQHWRQLPSPMRWRGFCTGERNPSRARGQVRQASKIMRRNKENFRLFGPDESQSNRLDATYEVPQKAWAASCLDASCPDGSPGMPSALGLDGLDVARAK